MSWISIDIDLDNIYDELGRYEKEQLADWLKEDGILPIPTEEDSLYLTGDESHQEHFTKHNLIKIFKNYLQLSNEDEELIKKIADKL